MIDISLSNLGFITKLVNKEGFKEDVYQERETIAHRQKKKSIQHIQLKQSKGVVMPKDRCLRWFIEVCVQFDS